MKKADSPSFWVSNISNRNVSLADLNLTIRAFTAVNLLDKKHYSYTLEQLQKSAASGSIAAKSDKIVVRKNPPKINKANVPINKESSIPSRERSVFSIKEEYYEELDLTAADKRKQDEEFAVANAELSDDVVTPQPKKA